MSEVEVRIVQLPHGADLPLPAYQTAHAAGLDLLAAVPAGKLAIADLPLVTPRETEELELAGCDAVIVATGDIAAMAGDLPPDV